MSRSRVPARLLALATFFALATGSATALADLAGPPELAPEQPKPEVKQDDVKADDVKTDDVKTDETKTDDAKTDDAKTDDAKTDDAKAGDTKKSGSCSMVGDDDRVIGLAGLVLLISGFALRRRRG